ncbi:hypothetical protein [Ulvibacterium marinum]|uniref:hypothetical protein n=1 Tax=Ulvibacterium marinum TaxID=2419782 RepID=UPI002495A1F6|nr:hypothetical protein [Ulvibacterium marinum]
MKYRINPNGLDGTPTKPRIKKDVLKTLAAKGTTYNQIQFHSNRLKIINPIGKYWFPTIMTQMMHLPML